MLIFQYGDGKYYCLSCGKEFKITDADMIKWFADREGEKIEHEDCHRFEVEGHVYGCGGINTVEVHLHKNDVTLEWQVGWGVCKQCGKRFIV